MSPDLSDTSKLIDLLRSKGVRLYESNGVKLELGPIPDDGKPVIPTADPDMCRCKHHASVHQEGLCTLGCEPSQCLDGETERKLEAEMK